MHHIGCMAALKLTWFRAQSAFDLVSPTPDTRVVKTIVLIVEQFLMK